MGWQPSFLLTKKEAKASPDGFQHSVAQGGGSLAGYQWVMPLPRHGIASLIGF